MKTFVVLPLLLVFLLTASDAAQANPRPLPFSYPYETLPAKKIEFEQYVDLIPIRVPRELPDGTQEAVIGLRSMLQTEIEMGLTDRLEVGFYFVFQQGAVAGSPSLTFSGVKQRLRYRLGEQGEWPVDIGLYFEVAEFHDELEFEQKVILQRRFGKVTAVINLWVEQEWYFQTGETKFIYNPTAGVTFEVSPSVVLGLEYWARGRFDGDQSSVHYLGPTILLQAGEAWLSLGAYVRLDKLGSDLAINDPMGTVWVRALLGIGL